MQKIPVGINGFGRFGQHLLKYWIENESRSNFAIDYINDAKLAIKDAYNILIHDQYLSFFYKSHLSIAKKTFLIQTKFKTHRIQFTTRSDGHIPWIGEPTFFFECSGENTNAQNCRKFLKGNTRLVIISATSLNADKTLIYGYNHHRFTAKDTVISYGSCTVNAYVPITNYIHKKYVVLDSDVNVIHNTPEYFLNKQSTLLKKTCTLTVSGPRLLTCINTGNFNVNYTMVPYTGVSVIDFRYKLKIIPSTAEITKGLEQAIRKEDLSNLYKIDPWDRGPEMYKFMPESAVLIKNEIKMIGDNLYIQAYFDNENSITRLYDLASYLTKKIEII